MNFEEKYYFRYWKLRLFIQLNWKLNRYYRPWLMIYCLRLIANFMNVNFRVDVIKCMALEPTNSSPAFIEGTLNYFIRIETWNPNNHLWQKEKNKKDLLKRIQLILKWKKRGLFLNNFKFSSGYKFFEIVITCTILLEFDFVTRYPAIVEK